MLLCLNDLLSHLLISYFIIYFRNSLSSMKVFLNLPVLLVNITLPKMLSLRRVMSLLEMPLELDPV